MKRRSIACIALLCVVLFANVAKAQDEKEKKCRENLAYLADAVKTCRLVHEGKNPPKLSDLYYESYADDVSKYTCPASGGERIKRTEIDDKSDYTLELAPGGPTMIVRERASHHGKDNAVLVVLEDGNIQAIALAGAPDKPAKSDDAAGIAKNDTPTKDEKPATTQPIRVVGEGGMELVSADGMELKDGVLVPIPEKDGDGQATDEVSLEDKNDRQRQSAMTLRGTGPAMTPEQQIALADMIYAQGGYDASVDLYEAVLASDPKNEAALMGFGRASVRTGSLRVARQKFDAAIAVNSKNIEAQCAIATIDLVLGNVKSAMATADKLLIENPDNQNVALLRAQCALLNGEDADAEKRFKSVAQWQPACAGDNRRLADAYREGRLLRLALFHERTSVALDPNDESSLLNAAVDAHTLGENVLAQKLSEQFLRQFPQSSSAATAKELLAKLQKNGG